MSLRTHRLQPGYATPGKRGEVNYSCDGVSYKQQQKSCDGASLIVFSILHFLYKSLSGSMRLEVESTCTETRLDVTVDRGHTSINAFLMKT